MLSPDRLVVEFFAPGAPRTKGSFIPFLPKGGGRPRMRPSNSQAQDAWLISVRTAADIAMKQGATRDDCLLDVEFRFRRPKSQYRTGRFERILRDEAPPRPTGSGSGDVDKLERAILDAMQGVVFDNDCQVYSVTKRKVYVDHYEGSPGAFVRVFAAAALKQASVSSG